MAKVLLKFKEAVLKEIPLDKEATTIGRKEENDIVIDNQAVSGHHAKIVQEGGSFFIEDLSSLNGTFVNGYKITRCELFKGDTILVGLHSMDFLSDKVRPEEDKKSFTVRGRSMDETMVIDPRDQKRILTSQDKEKPDVLGGFMVLDGSTDKRDYELKERVSTIGKEDGAAIHLKGSPLRWLLWCNRRKEWYFITPSGGKSLRINGQEIDLRYDLKDGDIVEIGGIKLQFYFKE